MQRLSEILVLIFASVPLKGPAMEESSRPCSGVFYPGWFGHRIMINSGQQVKSSLHTLKPTDVRIRINILEISSRFAISPHCSACTSPYEHENRCFI